MRNWHSICSIFQIMDIPRENGRRQCRIRRGLYAASGLLMIALITMGLSRLQPAAPSMDRRTLATTSCLAKLFASLLSFIQFFYNSPSIVHVPQCRLHHDAKEASVP